MSKIVYENLKNKLDQLYKRNFAVQVGFYDDNDNLHKEQLIPLGNYIYNSMPSSIEQKMTQSLSFRISK